MDCTRCHQPLVPGSTFCTSCGERAAPATVLRGSMGRRRKLPPPPDTSPGPAPTPGAGPTPTPAEPLAQSPTAPAPPPTRPDTPAVVVTDPRAESGPGAGPEAAAPDAPRRRRRWPYLVAAVGLALIAVALGGALLGYRWATRSHQPTSATSKVVVQGAPRVGDPGAPLSEPPSQMPDVTRLTRAEALEALGDIGIDPASVTFTERPYVGDPGRVVTQSPVRGTSDPKTVSLVLSTRATVPDLAGRPQDEAKATLERLGVVVQIEEVYRPGTAAETVVATTPAKGEALEATAVVEVSADPHSIFVSTIDPVDGGCSTGTANAGTQTSDHALVCRAGYLPDDGVADPTLAYDLAGRADQLTATVGIPNDNATGTRARVRVVVDGEERFNQLVATGTNVPLSVDLTGRARLDVYVTEPSVDDPNWDGAEVVLLDARFLGSGDHIDELGQ